MDALLHTPNSNTLNEDAASELRGCARVAMGDEAIYLVREPTTGLLTELQRLGEYCPYDNAYLFDTPEAKATYDRIYPRHPIPLDGGGEYVPPEMFAVIPGGHPSINVPAIIEHKLNAIDEAAGEARRRHCSCGWGIEEEYRLTEREAREFATAGYPAGAVPPCVQAEATTANTTAQQAADNIITRANALNAALGEIRTLRLTGKRAVESCAFVDPANPTGTEMRALLAAGEIELQQLRDMAAAVVGS